MGRKIIDVRGRTIAVEAKTGYQLVLVKQRLEKRTDEQLDQYARETEKLLAEYGGTTNESH